MTLGGKVSNHGTQTASATASVTIDLGDFYFGPTFIKVKPGQQLTLVLKNTGTYPHTFTSLSLKVDQALAPGTSATVMVTGPQDGSDVYFCRYHQAQGMQGAVFVR